MDRKKAFSTVLAAVMALSLFAVPAHAAGTSFTDVPANAYYAEAVAWAVGKSITTGTTATTFSPNATCTRAQILTFIWRAKGSPEPDMEKISAPNGNPFPDLDGGEYYYKAAQWAYTQGMVAGGMNFDGGKECSRSLAMTYFWEMSGEPTPKGEAGFTDIIRALHNIDAVSWAVEQGITTGTTATTFNPDATCTRGQIVTFLYRSMADKGAAGGEAALSPAEQAIKDKFLKDVEKAAAEGATISTDATTNKDFEEIGSQLNQGIRPAVPTDAEARKQAFINGGFQQALKDHGYTTAESTPHTEEELEALANAIQIG